MKLERAKKIKTLLIPISVHMKFKDLDKNVILSLCT